MRRRISAAVCCVKNRPCGALGLARCTAWAIASDAAEISPGFVVTMSGGNS
jgi:hypothetical protein